MAVNKQSFAKKFAENGQRTVWEEAQYKLGWETVGIRPPTKEQFNYLFYNIDEKFSFLSDELDRKTEDAAGKGLPVGAVIGFPRAITNQEGYLKADGSTFAQATYPDLHRVLGGNKLPNLTRSDVGMTAYFPVDDIPAGWLKYDDIAARVNQSDYPELYRKLTAQYGSISAVPKAEDRFIRNAAGGLTVGTQQSDAIRNITGTIDSGSGASSQLFDGIDGDGQGALYISRKQYKNWVAEGIGGANNVPAAFSFDASRVVPTADENRPKALAMVLCIKAQNSLDDVVMWIKAYGKVTNAGVLDASTLAAGLQNKSDKGHTHRAAEITDFAQAIGNLFTAQKTASGYLKLPGGLILQWGTWDTAASPGERAVQITFPIAFPAGCLNLQATRKTAKADNDNDGEVLLLSTNKTGAELYLNSSNGGTWLRGFTWFAIGY